MNAILLCFIIANLICIKYSAVKICFKCLLHWFDVSDIWKNLEEVKIWTRQNSMLCHKWQIQTCILAKCQSNMLSCWRFILASKIWHALFWNSAPRIRLWDQARFSCYWGSSFGAIHKWRHAKIPILRPLPPSVTPCHIKYYLPY